MRENKMMGSNWLSEFGLVKNPDTAVVYSGSKEMFTFCYGVEDETDI